MNKIIPGLITVRSKSTRLPRKCFLPFGGCGTVIEYLIKRCRDGKIDPVICTTNEKEDDVFIEVAKRNSCRIFRGPEKNKLKRWVLCADHFNINEFHTIDADDPFFDPVEMHRSMLLLKRKGYSVVFPSKYSSNGGASVGYSIDVSKIRGIFNTNDDHDTEMVDVIFKKLPSNQVGSIKSHLIIKARLTLDYAEDYSLLEFVARVLRNQASRTKIFRLFKENPELYKLNWFRNVEWSKNQDIKRAELI